MSEHTKEPWGVPADGNLLLADADGNILITSGGETDYGMVAYATSPEDARRICACVNACAGIPNEVLECDTPTFIAMNQERHSLRKQRDDMLAALQRYVEHFGDPLQCARAAIAKAES